MPMKKSTVFITGASSGIGMAVAREFARMGADLVVTGRRKPRLDALAAELMAGGARVLSIACDVTCDQEMHEAVVAAVKEFGQIDVVIANAGFGVVGKFEKLNIDDFRRQFETNVFGVLRTIQCTLNELKRTQGTLVLLGSMSGYISLPGVSAYSMSKFAIHALANALKSELKPQGISVVLIAPGFVESEIRKIDNQGHLHPEAEDRVPRWLMASADSAAKTIVRAVMKRKPQQIVTWHGQVAIFLKRHFPWVIDCLIGLGLKGRVEP